MIIDLNSLTGKKGDFDVQIPGNEIDLDIEGAVLISPVRIGGRVEVDQFRTHLNGTVEAEIQIGCTRCLDLTKSLIDIEFAADYVTKDQFEGTDDHEVVGEDLGLDVFDGERLDLKEIAREQLLLNIPEQTFCDPNCKGICPKCGANRNLIDCKCSDNEIDPRWSALKDIK